MQDHGELVLAGRRLFDGNSDDYFEDDLTNPTTPRALESNIVLVSISTGYKLWSFVPC